MAKNPYTPTSEQAARYREEMKWWEDARLVNKEYYSEIDAEMEILERPTIADSVGAMCRKGSKAFYDRWGHLNQELNVPTFDSVEISHEVAHLCPRLAHTFQQEVPAEIFWFGLSYGLAIRQCDASQVSAFQKRIESWIGNVKHNGLLYDGTVLSTSRAQLAVMIAAGMYLREKLDAFKREGLLAKGYAEQEAFCNEYGSTDHSPPISDNPPFSKSDADYKMEEFANTPYALIQLSKKEWRSIEAVALGLCEPENTDYPQRMSAIQQSLEVMGIVRSTEVAPRGLNISWVERMTATCPTKQSAGCLLR